MMEAAAASGATLLPVDSEHNAVFQCFDRARPGSVRRIILTASGGPFRDWPIERMRAATAAEAVAHPNWSMGAKISVDCATLMNKGLELIEAFHLFPVGAEALDVVVHPQSVIHSLVEYVDGSVLAQLGAPDMRIPIAHTLGLARADGDALPAARSGRDRHARLRGARPGTFPGARPCPPGAGRRAAPSRQSSMPPTR